ncbi:hypothetical protein Hanom_Chr04g00317931 [Helianthus anomalus]
MVLALGSNLGLRARHGSGHDFGSHVRFKFSKFSGSGLGSVKTSQWTSLGCRVNSKKRPGLVSIGQPVV